MDLNAFCRLKDHIRYDCKDIFSSVQKPDFNDSIILQSYETAVFSHSVTHKYQISRFMAKIRPDLMQKFKPSDQPAKQRENIGLFSTACTAIGVPGTDLFQTIDLHEHKDPGAVANCLSRLGGVVSYRAL